MSTAATKRRAEPRTRRTRTVITLLLSGVMAMLLAPLLFGGGAAAATPAVGCLPQVDKTGCIAGTLGGRDNPVGSADMVLTAPDGTEETVTTADDGKFAFTITEPGQYLVAVDKETLPDGLELLPPAANVRGPDDSLKVQAALGASRAAVLNVRSVDYQDSESFFDTIAQSAVSGLRLGLLLALASLGLSLIYGTTGISSFAHAEQVTLGGVVAVGLVSGLGMNLWLGIVCTVILCALSGLIQDVVLWKPLRHRGLGLTQLMLVTIGLSLTLQYTFQFFMGGTTRKVIVKDFGTTSFGSVSLPNLSFVAMGVSVVAIAAVAFGLLRTRLGRATRAVSDNPALAAASGIDVDKIVRLVWVVAAGLAGLAGVFYALVISNGIRWDTGMEILLLLFAAVTLGGLGTAFGALIGSLVIGMVVELAGPLGAPGDLKFAVALTILILLLMVRPQGLLGRVERVG